MKSIYIVALAMLLALTGCGGDDNGSSEQASSEKSINSRWETEGTGIVLDFSNHVIGTEREMIIFMADGGRCDCSVLFVGTNLSGQMSISSCLTKVPGNNNALTCRDAEKTASYEIENSVLTICENGVEDGCATAL